MKLAFKKTGEGPPFLILHGLFGSADNWQSHARTLSEKFTVYTIDQRNHGHSPHSENMTFDAMSEDLLELIADEGLRDVILMGHSMGGKTAMTFAQQNDFLVERLIVVDMGVKMYKPHHDRIFEGLLKVDVKYCTSRSEAERRLSPYVDDVATLQFLMKGLYWKSPGQLAWRFNVQTLFAHNDQMLAELDPEKKILLPTLFIRGANSHYINDKDLPDILRLIPSAVFVDIPDAGHWPHAENPAVFMHAVKDFIGF